MASDARDVEVATPERLDHVEIGDVVDLGKREERASELPSTPTRLEQCKKRGALTIWLTPRVHRWSRDTGPTLRHLSQAIAAQKPLTPACDAEAADGHVVLHAADSSAPSAPASTPRASYCTCVFTCIDSSPPGRVADGGHSDSFVNSAGQSVSVPDIWA